MLFEDAGFYPPIELSPAEKKTRFLVETTFRDDSQKMTFAVAVHAIYIHSCSGPLIVKLLPAGSKKNIDVWIPAQRMFSATPASKVRRASELTIKLSASPLNRCKKFPIYMFPPNYRK